MALTLASVVFIIVIAWAFGPVNRHLNAAIAMLEAGKTVADDGELTYDRD